MSLKKQSKESIKIDYNFLYKKPSNEHKIRVAGDINIYK